MSSLSTSDYLQQIAPKQDYSQQDYPCMDRLSLVHREHPILTKISAVFLLVLGIALIATLPLTRPLLGAWAVPSFSTIGGVVILASLSALVAMGIMGIIFPPHRSMHKHTYSPPPAEIHKENSTNQTFESDEPPADTSFPPHRSTHKHTSSSTSAEIHEKNSTHQKLEINGFLSYEGDIPIFTLNSAENRVLAGLTYGYLSAHKSSQLFEKLRLYLHKVGPLLDQGMPKADEIDPDFLAQVRSRIPNDYLLEIKGFVEGFNTWCEENGKSGKKTTEDEILMFHLLPERFSLSIPERQKSAMACTAIMAQDDEKGMVFGRNLDWETYGFIGNYTCVIKRVFSDGRITTEVNTPGLLGVLSGMNHAGLCVAMNVCPSDPTKKVEGMPAVFYNRYLLENFTCALDAKDYVKSLANPPHGRYHLSLVDEKNAFICHLFQDNQEIHSIRTFAKDDYLYTTNILYEDGLKTGHHCNESFKRESRLESLFKHSKSKVTNPQKRKMIKHALTLPYVNSNSTTHSILFYPAAREIKLGFDNSYAASVKKTRLSANVLFSD